MTFFIEQNVLSWTLQEYLRAHEQLLDLIIDPETTATPIPIKKASYNSQKFHAEISTICQCLAECWCRQQPKIPVLSPKLLPNGMQIELDLLPNVSTHPLFPDMSINANYLIPQEISHFAIQQSSSARSANRTVGPSL